MNNSIIISDFSKEIKTDYSTGKNQNGWQELLPYLSPELINNIENFQDIAGEISPKIIFWMKNHAQDCLWFNQLFLAAIFITPIELASPYHIITSINAFYKYLIPNKFAIIENVNPAKAIKNVFIEVSLSRGNNWLTCLSQYELHKNNYIKNRSSETKESLNRFLLPRLIVDKEISQLRTKGQEETRRQRKKRVEGILNEWDSIKQKVPIRYKWMKVFESKYQEVLKSVAEHLIELPQEITMVGFDGITGNLKFKVWNQHSWVTAHKEKFPQKTVYKLRYKDKFSTDAFVQFIGSIPVPECDWFLEAIHLGIIQGGNQLSNDATNYLTINGLTRTTFRNDCILRCNSNTISNYVCHAKRTCSGNEKDSNIIFSIEPLLLGATLGTFCFETFVKTTIRVGEILQVSMDKECLDGLYLATFNDKNQTYEKCNKPNYFWKLYPKGKTNKREVYEVDEIINGMLLDWLNLHKRYLGYPIQAITPNPDFTHLRKYPGKYKFVVQWNQAQLSGCGVNAVIAFMMLNHGSKDVNGEPVNITSHDIRHCVVTSENKNGATLEKLMKLLHHINPPTTEYYSELPFEDLIRELLPILEVMNDEIQIDPTSLRNIDDVKKTIFEMLKKFGALRNIPGGKCSSYKSCKRLFLCARCINFIPGISEADINEILEVINVLEKGAQIFEREKLSARQERQHIEEWKLVLAEIESWRRTLDLPIPEGFPFSELSEGKNETGFLFE